MRTTNFIRSAEDDFSGLWALAVSQLRLGPDTDHGPAHWQRVERNGLKLAESTGADRLVVRLFAVLHDSKRQNEFSDPEHGPRAAAWARQLRNARFELTDKQLDSLCEAMELHDAGLTSEHATIGTCWDADRLDLPRVGIRPVAKLMSTAAGKAAAERRGGLWSGGA